MSFPGRGTLPVHLGIAGLYFLMLLNAQACAQTVWSGFGHSFAKTDFADYTLPANQDHITSSVHLTRGDSQGLFNIAQEDFWDDDGNDDFDLSPLGTLWATTINNPGTDELDIEATNWSQLDFAPWIEAYGGRVTHTLPETLTSRNAVVYLLTDNVYLDLRFTSWSLGSGGFSYERAEPATAATTGDYNNDRIVNAADYTTWRNTLGANATPQGSGADGVPDGLIDGADYTFWKTHFGQVVAGSGGGSAQASGVPEPSTVMLLLGGLLLIMTSRKISPRGPGQNF
jgi:hypothetical protein